MFMNVGRLVVIIIPLVIYTGCGINKDKNRELHFRNETKIKAIPEDLRYQTRFSTTEATSLEDGVLQMVAYGKGSTAVPLPRVKTELGEYTIASESKLFMPSPLARDQIKTKVISVFQQVSKMKDVTLSNGKVVFSRADSVDINGKSIPEVVTGTASVSGENRFISLAIATGKNDAKGIVRMNISEDEGLIKQMYINQTDLKMKILFTDKTGSRDLDATLVKKNDFFSKVEFYPYKSGYLIYCLIKMKGASSIITSQMNADMVKEPQIGILEYIRKQAFGFKGWLIEAKNMKTN